MFRLNDPKIKWLFLTVGAMSILLSGPVLRISMAGWLLPIGVLYFMRASTILKGYLWTVLFMAIFMFIQGLFSAALPATASLVAAIISALLEALPYLLDRIFYKKVNSRFSIFLLPLLAVSYEYLISFPLSSIGVLAATQTDFLALAQLASITGVLGVSFMMYWLAAMVVSALLSETRISQFKLYGGVMFLILVFGFAKMRFTDPMQPTVKVAGISLEENTLYSALYEDFFGETVSFEIGAGGSPELNKLFGALKEFQKNPEDERFQGAFGSMKAFEDQLIQVTKQAALTDAKIIVWSETNLPVFKDREQEVLERVREIAMSSKTIVVTSMAVLVPYVEGGPMYENKSVVITAGGEFADYYEKARPVPFLDASLPGDGKLEVVSTPYGDLTTAICYDADFSRFAGTGGPGGHFDTASQ